MPLQTHGPGLKLVVEESLRGVIAIGMLEADDLTRNELPPEFATERDRVIARLITLYAGKQPADIPGVSETSALFHQLDVDPTKHRPSSEALLRRALQGKGLPVVHPAVDVCNLCSLEHQIPLGLYDRASVSGAVNVRAGREGEGYTGIRKQRVHLAGRLLLADDHGAFGAPTSDSLRTAVGSSTQSLLAVLFCPMERAGQTLTEVLEHIADRLTRWCAARVTSVRVVQ